MTGKAGATPAPLDTFPRLLLHHAQVRGNHPAMREKDLGIWQTQTWADVANQVTALACGLAQLGFQRGDRLAVIGDNVANINTVRPAGQEPYRAQLVVARSLPGTVTNVQ